MNIEISKLKARRGTDDQRKLLIFDQGEVLYTVDTKRLFVGNGVTNGGDVVGNKMHPPIINYYSLSSTKAEVGDTVPLGGVIYQLIDTDYTTLSSWQLIRLGVDPVTFYYDVDNNLFISPSSLSAILIDPDTVTDGVIIESGILKANINTKSLEISASKISLKQSGIDEREISSTSFGNGISGGSGNKINLVVDLNNFYFDSTTLKLSGFNPFTLKFTDLNQNWFGSGLTYNSSVSSLSTIVTGVSGDNIIMKDSAGKLYFNTSIIGDGLEYSSSLSSLHVNTDSTTIVISSGELKLGDSGVSSGTNQWPSINVDQYGRITNIQSSIFDTLSGNASLSSYNITNSLSAIFNGSPSQSLSGAIPGLQLTTFTALSSNGSVITLSSAGFITFEGNTTTRTGKSVGRFAIPIFTY